MYFYSCFGPSSVAGRRTLIAVYCASSHREARYNFRRDYNLEEGDISLKRITADSALKLERLFNFPIRECSLPQKSGYHYSKHNVK